MSLVVMPKSSKKKGSTTPAPDPKNGAGSRRVNYRDRVNDRQLEEALKKSKEIADTAVGPSSSGRPTPSKILATHVLQPA